MSPEQLFNPPASEEYLCETEATLKVRFPLDLRRAYARHDGCISDVWHLTAKLPYIIPPYFRWISLAEMCRTWRRDRRNEESIHQSYPNTSEVIEASDEVHPDPVRNRQFDAEWIPVGVSDMGPVAYVDLHPSPWGRMGQLIECSPGSNEFLCASFISCVESVTEALETKRYVFDMAIGGWVSSRTGTVPLHLDDL